MAVYADYPVAVMMARVRIYTAHDGVTFQFNLSLRRGRFFMSIILRASFSASKRFDSWNAAVVLTESFIRCGELLQTYPTLFHIPSSGLSIEGMIEFFLRSTVQFTACSVGTLFCAVLWAAENWLH